MDSSTGRALAWRAKRRWFDPISKHHKDVERQTDFIQTFNLGLKKLYKTSCIWDISSMVEHSAVNRRVTGSSPVCPARVATTQRKCCGWFWSAFHQYINKSALVCGCGGIGRLGGFRFLCQMVCGFESHYPHHCWFYYFINVRVKGLHSNRSNRVGQEER